MSRWQRVKDWLLGVRHNELPEYAPNDWGDETEWGEPVGEVGPTGIEEEPHAGDLEDAWDEPTLLLALVPSGVRIGWVEGVGQGKRLRHFFVEADTGLRHPISDLDSFYETASEYEG